MGLHGSPSLRASRARSAAECAGTSRLTNHSANPINKPPAPCNHDSDVCRCARLLRPPAVVAIARRIRNIFRQEEPLVAVPIELIQRCFRLLETEASGRSDIYGVDAWLNATALRDPTNALEAAEIYLDFVGRTKPYVYDHNNNLTQLLTRLFAQAEEQEESDCGVMLQRVVAMQDALLALGVNGVSDWLKAAERP
jgi:hypothetical protein